MEKLSAKDATIFQLREITKKLRRYNNDPAGNDRGENGKSNSDACPDPENGKVGFIQDK